MNGTSNAFVLNRFLDAIASATERWVDPRRQATRGFVIVAGGGKGGFGALARVNAGHLGTHVEYTDLVVQVILEDLR